MTTAAAMRDATLRYFACLDAEDWVGMADLWAEDGRLLAVGARPREGREEVLEYYGKLFTPWQRHEDRPTRVIVAETDETVVAEVTFFGTTQGGRDVRFDAVDVFDFRDGCICKLTNWYDIAYARKTLSTAS
jgi:ketosteroid isomerase-like protein